MDVLPFGVMPFQYRRKNPNPELERATNAIFESLWRERSDEDVNGWVRQYHEWYYEQEKEVAEIEAKKKVAVAEQEKLEAETVAKRVLSVATLDRQSAEQKKQAAILIAEGESEARRLVLAADGALKVKVEAYIQTQKLWAEAFGQYRGAIVPAIQMGSNGQSGNGTSANGMETFMQLVGMKAAKDLALDMNITNTK